MENREMMLFKILYKAQDYVSAENLCAVLDIKPRTLRDDLKRYRETVEDKSGAIIESKMNRGYRLVIKDETRFYDYVQKLLQEEVNAQYIMPVMQEDRVNYIIRYFLSQVDWVKSDDLAQDMYISRSTFSADLKKVKEQLAAFNLKLVTRVGAGMKIEGAEKDIRSCIARYYIHGVNSRSTDVSASQILSFDSKWEQKIHDALLATISKYGFKLTDIGFQNLIIHLLIAIYRIQESIYIYESEEVEEKLKATKEWVMADDLANRLEKEFTIKIPDSERAYITMHLKGKRALTMDDESAIRPDVLNVISHILIKIKQDYGFDFQGDFDLFSALALHIQPMLSRTAFGLKVQNPLIEQIKKDNPLSYEIATVAANCLKEEFGNDIDENEIGYLALHFQLAITRYNNGVKKNLLVVCASGGGTSQILKYKMQKQFHDSINEIDVANSYSLDSMDLSKYDGIISTIPLHNNYGIPVIQVQYFLDAFDVENVRTLIQTDEHEIELLRHCFRPELFFENQEFDNERECIAFLSKKAKDYVPKGIDLEKLTLEREEMSTTAIGNGIATPHPIRLVAEETSVAVCILKKPMLWGSREVTVIFFLLAKKDSDEALKLFNKIMGMLITNTQLLNRFKAEPTYENLMNEMQELYQIQKGKKQESIFQ